MLAGGCAAAIPLIVAGIHYAAAGWVPLGDDAFVAVRSFDVLSSRSPLVGQWSAGATETIGETVYSPGPMLFWLLALPVRLFDPGSLSVAMALVNCVSVVGTVALAHRRGGLPLMGLTALALPLMLASLPAEAWADVWNSSAPLLPFTLLVFLAWSVGSGDYLGCCSRSRWCGASSRRPISPSPPRP